jgi:hypothetical protein
VIARSLILLPCAAGKLLATLTEGGRFSNHSQRAHQFNQMDVPLGHNMKRYAAIIVLLTKCTLIGMAAGALLGAFIGAVIGAFVFGLIGTLFGTIIGGFTGGPIAGSFVFSVILFEIIRGVSKRSMTLFITLGGIWGGIALGLIVALSSLPADIYEVYESLWLYMSLSALGVVCGLLGAAILKDLGAPRPADTGNTQSAYQPTWPAVDSVQH